MSGSISNVLALGMPMGSEWVVIGLLGLLIFGKRLPEVGKAVGKTLKQFREGMNGVKEEISDAVGGVPTVHSLLTGPDSTPTVRPDSKPTVRPSFKFDPYTGKPVEETERVSG